MVIASSLRSGGRRRHNPLYSAGLWEVGLADSQGEGREWGAILLQDHYVDASGEPILLPGLTLDAEDHLYEPHTTSFEEMVTVLGTTARRRFTFAHLQGLLLWLDDAMPGGLRVWVRGELASTLRPEPSQLDVVALIDEQPNRIGTSWVARVLETRPQLSPIELVFAIVRIDDAEVVERERRRSAVRCRDKVGDPIVTGWLEVTL